MVSSTDLSLMKIMTAICDDRLHLGGERMPAFEKIDVQLNSPYNGILLWQGIHGLMDSNNLALLRVCFQYCLDHLPKKMTHWVF
jgi:hypothetical protein